MKSTQSKVFLSIAVAVFLLFFLLRNIPFETIRENIVRIKIIYLYSAFAAYFFANAARSVRFYFLLDGALRPKTIFSITLIHNFLVNLLPFRTGELSYIYLAGRAVPAGLPQGVGSLLISRLFDILIIANLLLVSIAFVSKSVLPETVSGAILLFAIFTVFASCIFIFFASFLFRLLSRALSSVSEFFFRSAFSGENVLAVGEVFMKARRSNYFLKIFAASCCIWFFNFLVGLFLFRALAFDFTFFETVLIFSFPMIVSVVSPIQSFANLGLYEWSLVGGFSMFGVEHASASAVSVVIHGIEIVFALVFGVMGALIYYAGIRKKSA